MLPAVDRVAIAIRLPVQADGFQELVSPGRINRRHGVGTSLAPSKSVSAPFVAYIMIIQVYIFEAYMDLNRQAQELGWNPAFPTTRW
jgi:hypothetical protein